MSFKLVDEVREARDMVRDVDYHNHMEMAYLHGQLTWKLEFILALAEGFEPIQAMDISRQRISSREEALTELPTNEKKERYSERDSHADAA